MAPAGCSKLHLLRITFPLLQFWGIAFYWNLQRFACLGFWFWGLFGVFLPKLMHLHCLIVDIFMHVFFHNCYKNATADV